MTQVNIINTSGNPLPRYMTPQSAGMDLYAHLSEAVLLKKGQRALIPTGIRLELPAGFEAQIRPRSGLAYKHGITVLNAPGTIDADYRGDVGVILINLGEEDFSIENGERIAQMVIAAYEQVEWKETDSLSDSERGAGGFGHSGK